MSDKTNIDYCDHTWSPWQGCSPVSPGCAHCYMLALMRRWGKNGTVRTLTKDWKKLRRWNNRLTCDCGCVKPHIENIYAYPCPRCRSDYRPARVLVSMCDPFDDEVPADWHLRFLELISETPNLTWLLLTKRPQNVQTIGRWPDNVWIGVSAEDQQRADERIPILLRIPARTRWVSVEPMLGPVEGWFGKNGGWLKGEQIDWVIVGGESGFNHRRCEIEWIQSIADQCKVADVPCFVKQDSHRLPGQQGRIPDDLWAIKQFPTV